MSLKRKKPKVLIDSLTIDSGHSIMVQHTPQIVGAQSLSENFYKWHTPTPESIERFGFFGDGLNYNTYYPDAKPEDFKPNADEFIEPMFRLLSATIVSKNYNPTDFGHNKGVLKNSMHLLLGQTVNCDHETNIGNAIGSVSEVVWQEGYRDNGINIPAGINGVLKIDGKANPRIARGILMEPPSIHSNSVTVQFAWEQSHPKMEYWDFIDKLGTYDDKGEMVRRIVTNIIRYHETSLVSHGADPYAQKINSDGRLNNPIFADRTWNSFAEYQEDKNKIYVFEDNKLNLREIDDTKLTNNKIFLTQNYNSMDELQAFLEILFAEGMLTLAEGQEMNQETAVSSITALIASNNSRQAEVTSLNEQITKLKEEKASLEGSIAKLKEEKAALEEMANIGTAHLTQVREEATASYRKLMGEQVDETIINMLAAPTTGLNTLLALNKDYTERLNAKFPLKCSKCGSLDVSRASSVQEPEDTTQNGEERKTAASALDNIYKNKFRKNN